jgi:branched-chain amino acid transport system ATP-binding protein
VLRIEGLDTYYGQVQALFDVSLTVKEGEVVALLGANGAGKTTVLRTISGLVQPRNGTIELEGRTLNGLMPHDVSRLGVAHCPEGRLVFETMTVDENLELGAYFIKDRSAIDRQKEEVFRYFPILKDRLWQRAGTFSGGEQQMLAIARALMSKPKIILLDEPSLGLAPILVGTVFQIIKQLHKAGNTILLVEQNANMALEVADRAYVLETGSVVLSASSAELRNNPIVKKKYLGQS